jgi:phosphatidate cytidylyltransferase
MLRARLAVAIIGIPIVLALIVVGGVPFLIGLALVAILALAELRTLFAAIEIEYPLSVAALATVAMIVAGWSDITFLAPLGFSLLAGAIWCILSGRTDRGSVFGWPLAVFATVYIGLPLGLMAQMIADQSPVVIGTITVSRGAVWILIAVLLTWATDSAAYFAGRAFGRRPLAPAISPRKTLEGGAAGLLASCLAAIVLGSLVDSPIAVAALFGLAIGLVAIAGDLAESLLKRVCQVKDSGRLFPGHGGVLDRIDSLLFVVPIVALWARLVAFR